MPPFWRMSADKHKSPVKPSPQIDLKKLERSRRAANMMCLLCLLNIGPVLLLTAMGMAGAAITYPERNFPTARAMLIGLVVFALPFLITQAFVRRGHRGAILFSVLVALLFLAGAAFLMVDVMAGPSSIQFKLLAGMLSLIAMGGYGLGTLRLLQAAREVRGGQASGTGNQGR